MSAIPNRLRVTLAAALMALGALALTAEAQVVINMPAPKRTPAPAALPAPTFIEVQQTAGALVIDGTLAPAPPVLLALPDPGELALARYTRGRTAPNDTYYDDPIYAGIRSYSYPVYYSFPWFGFHHSFFHFPFFCR